jgi:glycerol-1-phosphate dehydrogenase [NAD(P)+]
MGREIATQCHGELTKKAFTKDSAAVFNENLKNLWPTLRDELKPFIIPVSEIDQMLKAAGGPRSARDLELPVEFYREAVRHNREMRNRFSFVDIAADAGLLDAFAQGEN